MTKAEMRTGKQCSPGDLDRTGTNSSTNSIGNRPDRRVGSASSLDRRIGWSGTRSPGNTEYPGRRAGRSPGNQEMVLSLKVDLHIN